ISLPGGRERWNHRIRHFDSLHITPQVAIPTDTFYTDTSNYTYFEQTFVADGGEQYITMGNFYPIEQTLYKNLYTHEVFSTYLEDTTINQVSFWHIDDLNLQLVPQPGQAFTHSKDTIICPGESVVLFAQLDIPGNYLWSTEDTTSSIIVSEPGTYEVTASCPCGIEYTAQIEVTVLDELPNISLPDTVICERENKLSVSLPEGLHYTLNGETVPHQFDIYNEGVYELLAQSECEQSEHVFEVNIDACEPFVYMPNAFTPNNDGRNDCYSISAQHVHNFQVYIYNRWGNEVYSSKDPNFCWDGTVNGTPSAQDVYTCVILYSETPSAGLVRYTQTVTLIR
ncbi:MAG: gliding motility-associated C-terminal domain-containing protein, partial [Cryomorphaceae bacterium]|nr:gliding motility-associated C-terminal domain-containing protein [Cryomorphaceae bacterium]